MTADGGRIGAGATAARVTVLTRPGCHLCADACAAVARVTAALGEGWTEVDITGDPALSAQWAEYIPVIVVDGKVHDWFRVDEERLRAALAGEPPSTGSPA